MSLITRCPQCSTLFRVVPDQIKVSSGWVRCGQCAHVFNASEHLQPAATPPPLLAPQTLDAPQANTSIVSANTGLVGRASPKLNTNFSANPSAANATSSANVGSNTHVLSTRRERPVPPPDEPDTSFSDEVQTVFDEELAQPSLPAGTPPTATPPNKRARTGGNSKSSPVKPSGATPARSPKRWLPALLWLVCVLLALALLIQILLQQRNHLAAHHPALSPGLKTLCSWLGCVVSPLQKIEAIKVDSSGLTKLRADSYRLNLTLKNQFDIALALPSVELSLTDAQDQVLLRRVFSARELGASVEATIAANAEWSGAVTFTLSLSPAVAQNISGYRVLAFYP